ncbi:MAG: DUF3987 domain-containing protein [Rhodocyclaceae bacterium]|nr:DUF3987 domain-containing protein [Rhodocyclaceae bacterium]
MNSTSQVTAAFANAMRAAGVEPPDEIIADGTIQRFALRGERGKRSGAYQVHADHRPTGWFQSHKGSGGLIRWSSGQACQSMSPADMKAFRREIAEKQRAREAAQTDAQLRAARLAKDIMEAADVGDPAEHAYAQRKRVPFGPLVTRGAWEQNSWADALRVPLFNAAGNLVSIQAIAMDGDKRFLKDGRAAGAFHPFGKLRGAANVLIGEGVATVATAVAVTGWPAAAAMSAGNLVVVARALRKVAASGARIVIVADNDEKTSGNTGVRSAKDAALATGALVAVPLMGGRKCDLWDVWNEQGPDAARACLAAAAPPAPQAETVKTTATMTDDWPDPQPIIDELLPVPAFDARLLPDPLASWVSDIAERMQCPPEFLAVGALAALGSVLGRRVAVRPKRLDDWSEFANLWGVVIGSPGVLKSPALNAVLAPLRRLEDQAHEQHEQAVRAWQAEAEGSKVRRDAAKHQANRAARKGQDFDASSLLLDITDDEPEAKRFVVNDATPEALQEILAANPLGVLAFRDELASLLAGMEREGREEQRGFFLSAYSGKEPYVSDRIGRGKTRVPACCLSLLGSTQPAVIAKYIREALDSGGGDGLLSRFSLLVWPDSPAQWRSVDRAPDAAARNAANELFQRLAEFDPAAIGAETEAVGAVPFVRFDDGARELFETWRAELERRLRTPDGDDLAAVTAHLAKYRKLAPALALIFHAVHGEPQNIDAATLTRALAWCDLLEAHARRAYGAARSTHREAARALLGKIKRGAIGAGGSFALREVYRFGWAQLDTRDRAKQAADLLADFDYLRAETIETAGRPSPGYRVNPKVLR